MTNRDTVLREVRDCILTGDEHRCKKLSNQQANTRQMEEPERT